jgi:hypothetical protein
MIRINRTQSIGLAVAALAMLAVGSVAMIVAGNNEVAGQPSSAITYTPAQPIEREYFTPTEEAALDALDEIHPGLANSDDEARETLDRMWAWCHGDTGVMDEAGVDVVTVANAVLCPGGPR